MYSLYRYIPYSVCYPTGGGSRYGSGGECECYQWQEYRRMFALPL